jgi:hypothetical protein
MTERKTKSGFKVIDNPDLTGASETASEIVARLNRHHIFIEDRPSGILVVPYDIDKQWRMITVQGFHNKFANRYLPILIDPSKPPKLVTFSELWFKSAQRRQYAETGFFPLGAEAPGCFNMYRGLKIEPRAGEWPLLRGFLRDVICGGVDALADYLLDWEAWKLQNPTELIGIAIVLVGPPGIGKGYFGKLHAKIYGSAQFIHFHQPQRADARFNGELESVLFAMYDEAFLSQSKTMEASLKGRVTEETLMIEHKGVDAYPITNKIGYIYLSNEDDALPFKPNDRRFFVLRVSDARQQDEDYFDKLDRALAIELPAFVDDMLKRDISEFNRRRRKAPPMTAAKMTMSFSSGVSRIEAFLLDLLKRNEWPGVCLRTGKDEKGNPVGYDEWMTKDIYFARLALHGSYRAWFDMNYPGNMRSMVTSDQLTARIAEILKFDPRVKQTVRFDPPSGKAKNAWGTPLPSRAACRKAFARYMNCDEDDIDWQKDNIGDDSDNGPFGKSPF